MKFGEGPTQKCRKKGPGTRNIVGYITRQKKKGFSSMHAGSGREYILF